MLLGILFCVCLITANVLETKQIAIGPLSITGGLLVFPLSYIINDTVCEVWGYAKAKLLIWMGFAMNFLFVFFGTVADALPAASYWEGEEGFHAVFGLAPRIAFASFMAFLVGSFINAYVMSRMKLRSRGRHFSLRAISSTVFGESADSLVAGEMVPLILSQIILKTLYEVIALPVTIRVVRATKNIEGIDVYDEGVNYRPW